MERLIHRHFGRIIRPFNLARWQSLPGFPDRSFTGNLVFGEALHRALPIFGKRGLMPGLMEQQPTAEARFQSLAILADTDCAFPVKCAGFGLQEASSDSNDG